MKQKRKKYTQEFKEEAVKLITEQGYQATEAARNLGVNVSVLSVLRRWKNEIEGAESGGADATLKAELKSLRKEVKRLKMEREILKKAAAFFANEIS